MILRKVSLAIWAAAFLIRLTLIFGFHRQELGGPEPVRIARELAARGAFADPYKIPTGPTAHSAPLYPTMLAPIYVLWGDTRNADLARVTFSAAGASGEYALLPWVAESLAMPAGVGVVAAVAGAILPLQYWPECMGEFEVTWVALALEWSVILFARFMARPGFRARSAVSAGAWGALCLLLSPNLLLPLGALLAIAWWRLRGRMPGHDERWLSPARWAAILAVTVLAGTAPWIARNYVRLGGLFFIRDDLGLELHISNNDEARADNEQNMRTAFFHREHPFMSMAAGRRVIEQGELAFEREHMRAAIDWIGRNPGKFWRLTAERVRNFWFPELTHPLHRYAVWALSLAAWIGLLYLSRTNVFAALVLGSLLAVFPVVYYFVENYLRYQHPIYWAMLLLAASPLGGGVIGKLSRRLRSRGNQLIDAEWSSRSGIERGAPAASPPGPAEPARRHSRLRSGVAATFPPRRDRASA